MTVSCLLTGCRQQSMEEAGKPLEYTVVEPDEVPAELQAKMEESKEAGFKLTYRTQESLYIAEGYGKQPTGGYSVAVRKLMLNDSAIDFETEMIGPQSGEKVSKEPSYPYIVVKTEYREQNVVFK
ncbi:MAG: protease complex subunit PrcB family protein [Eubacterium sp.]|nr:protease complex subunit PrcB family protein [Eubacterium sp.]